MLGRGGTQGAQNDAWLGSDIIGNFVISFSAGIACISSANLEVDLREYGALTYTSLTLKIKLLISVN